jgi:hypothetical protein
MALGHATITLTMDTYGGLSENMDEFGAGLPSPLPSPETADVDQVRPNLERMRPNQEPQAVDVVCWMLSGRPKPCPDLGLYVGPRDRTATYGLKSTRLNKRARAHGFQPRSAEVLAKPLTEVCRDCGAAESAQHLGQRQPFRADHAHRGGLLTSQVITTSCRRPTARGPPNQRPTHRHHLTA